MSWTNRRIRIIHDLAKGSNIQDCDTQATGTVPQVSEVYYAGDSFDLNLSLYDDYASSTLADFGTDSTASLYIKIYDADDIETKIASGDITAKDGETAYSEVEFSVASGMTSSYAGQACLLYAVIEDPAADGQVTISQPLTVSSLSGNGSGNVVASQMYYTPSTSSDWSTVPDDVAEALDTLASDLDGIDDSIATVAANVATVSTDLDTAEADIDQLEADVASNDGDIAALDARITANESDISDLQSDITSVTSSSQQVITLSGAVQTSKLWTVTAANNNGYLASCAYEELASGIMAYCTDSTAGTCLVHGTFSRSGNAGAILYLSTGGGITETAPSTSGYFLRVIGYQITSSQAYLCPSTGWGEIA